MTTFVAAPFFVLRFPYLPFARFDDWARKASTPSDVSGEAHADELAFRGFPTGWDRVLDEALFLASADLFNAIGVARLRTENSSEHSLDDSIARYFARACYRATPFGLFAAHAVGSVRDASWLERPARLHRCVRLDSRTFAALAGHARSTVVSAMYGRIWTNGTLLQSGTQLRWARRHETTGRYQFEQISMQVDDDVLAVVRAARNGCDIPDVVDALVHRGIDRDDARAAVVEMIDKQLLTTAFDISPCGASRDDELLELLGSSGLHLELRTAVRQARDSYRLAESSPLGGAIDHYRVAHVALETLLPAGTIKPPNVVLRAGPSALALSSSIADEVLVGVKALSGMQEQGEHSELANFRHRFEERFGDQSISLLRALDFEFGIGYGPPPPQHGSFAGLGDFAAPSTEQWRRKHRYLLSRLFADGMGQSRELVLDESDLRALAADSPSKLPESFAARVSLIASDEDGLNQGNFHVLHHGVLGPSAGRWLGRFATGDEELANLLEHHFRAEEALSPGTLYAEVSFDPGPRYGNVVTRPLLRLVELAVFDRPTSSGRRTIRLDELDVKVAQSRVVLIQRSTGRIVEPRFDCALAARYAASRVAEFLYSLQYQDAGGYSWDWGPLDTLPRLPRVRYGKHILSAARWTLRREEVSELLAHAAAGRVAAIQSFCDAREMPYHLGFTQGDNVLPVYFDSTCSVRSIGRSMRQQDTCQFQEMFVEPHQLVLRDDAGNRFTHEVILPFLATEPRIPLVPVTRELPRSASSVHLPGSCWVYLCVYTGEFSTDHLVSRFADCFRKLASRNLCSRWFFVRYGTPSWHLRVRYLVPASAVATARSELDSLVQSLHNSQLIWRAEYATYVPEVARYGGTRYVEHAERLFASDTTAVAELISLTGEIVEADGRWMAGLLNVRDWLNAFRMPALHRIAFLRQLSSTAGHKGADSDSVRRRLRTLSILHRTHSARIEGLFDESAAPSPWVDRARIALSVRQECTQADVDVLVNAANRRLLESPLKSVVASLIHMSLNRLLMSDHQRQEPVLLGLLERFEMGQLARRTTRGEFRELARAIPQVRWSDLW